MSNDVGTGLSLVGAFDTEDEGVHRRFAVSVDMRLIPTSKLKPDSASPFHGVQITDPAQDWWRPGMSGVCKIVAGRRSLLWVLAHHTVETLRLWLWW